jgi:cytoplasmic FMR1 interacting protein
MGFFQMRLKDVMSYRDLQTEVFHAFRTVGNAVACLQLLEECLVCHVTSRHATLTMP